MSANPGVFNSTDEDLVNLFNALGDATRAMQYLRALDPSALPAEDMAKYAVSA